MNRTLLVSTAAVMLACALLVAAPNDAAAGDDTVDEVAIDVDVTGNGDNVLGPTEFCNTQPLEVGETIEVDVVVRGVHDLAGYSFDLFFDANVLHVTRFHHFQGPTILAGGGTASPFVVLDYDGLGGSWGRPPGVTGMSRIDVVDLSGVPESGDGVLTRITFNAVGPGISTLLVGDLSNNLPWPTLLNPGANLLDPQSSVGAVVRVGDSQTCPRGHQSWQSRFRL